MNRIVSMLMAIGLCFLPLLGIAEEGTVDEPVILEYQYISNVAVHFSISSGIARCQGSGASDYSNTRTDVTVVLQRRPTGSKSWSTVCSWNDSKSGKAKAIVDETKAVSTGYDYRISVNCTIKDSSGNTLESTTKYSSIYSC